MQALHQDCQSNTDGEEDGNGQNWEVVQLKKGGFEKMVGEGWADERELQ